MSRVSVREYLTTDYSPDVEYVDGRLVDRNIGESSHGRMHASLACSLFTRRLQCGIHIYMSMRVKLSPRHFRVADICVIAGPEPREQTFTSPPFLWIEILSTEDRMRDMLKKIDDLLGFGVRYVWVVDPETTRAWIYTRDGITEARDGVLRTANPDIIVPMSSLPKHNEREPSGGAHNRWSEAARKHSRAMRHNTSDCSQRSVSSSPLNVRA
jgi:Uma2 family endonuclease